MACGKRILVGLVEVGKAERLTVTEWHGSAEPLRSDEGVVGRAKQARATPSSTRRGEWLRGAWFVCLVGTSDFGVFLPCPYPYFLRKDGRIAESRPRLIPPPPSPS